LYCLSTQQSTRNHLINTKLSILIKIQHRYCPIWLDTVTDCSDSQLLK
jgi:hypothetical protein